LGDEGMGAVLVGFHMNTAQTRDCLG
jgi:hypothetical protein